LLIKFIPQFAESSSGGISSLGINLKSFVFQLMTFLIVLGILRKWVFPKLVATLEDRRRVLEQSLEQARKTEQTLHETETKVTEVLREARVEGDKAIAEAKSEAKDIITRAEQTGESSAKRIIAEAEAHLGQERAKLHAELKKELAELVVTTTEKVLNKKLNAKDDLELVQQSVKELEG
jgi:F-type H+-transporting ATPase subunit b